MIAWWMTQSLVIGGWLALGAMLLEVALKRLGRPVRLGWFAGLVALFALSAWTIGRPEEAPVIRAASMPAPALGLTPATTVAPTPWLVAFAVPQQLLRRIGSTMVRLETTHGLGPWLAGGWLGLSALTAFGLLALHARLAVRRRRWRQFGDVDGVPVRLADDEGPFVLGVAPTEIVLPAWAAALPDDSRAVIVAHEREHVRGGDPWMLAVANAVLVALPWHPLAWWMHARLRLATELDCDRRCLAAGLDAGTYGRLLLAAADHTQSRLPWRAVAPAFATRRSHLERRLLAMTHITRRPRRAVALTAAAAAMVALVAACESTAPTAAQVAAADASTVKARIFTAVSDSNVTYTVNGKVVSAEEAKKFTASEIRTIALAKKTEAGQVRIDLQVDGTAPARTPLARVTPAPNATSGSATTLDQALVVIDGVVQANATALNALSPERIASVEIIKGEAARALYDVTKYPNAANGVVKITTKP